MEKPRLRTAGATEPGHPGLARGCPKIATRRIPTYFSNNFGKTAFYARSNRLINVPDLLNELLFLYQRLNWVSLLVSIFSNAGIFYNLDDCAQYPGDDADARRHLNRHSAQCIDQPCQSSGVFLVSEDHLTGPVISHSGHFCAGNSTTLERLGRAGTGTLLIRQRSSSTLVMQPEHPGSWSGGGATFSSPTRRFKSF